MNESEKKELLIMYGKLQGEDKNRLILKSSDEGRYIIHRDAEEKLINYEKIEEQNSEIILTGEFYELSPNNEFIRIK